MGNCGSNDAPRAQGRAVHAPDAKQQPASHASPTGTRKAKDGRPPPLDTTQKNANLVIPGHDVHHSSPRDPVNIPKNIVPKKKEASAFFEATSIAEAKFIALLQFVRNEKERQHARKFARWVPFQAKYEHYLFTDVLRILEIRQEQDMMSDDASVDGSEAGLSVDLNGIDVQFHDSFKPSDDWLTTIVKSMKGDKDLRALPDETTFIHLVKLVTDLFTPMDACVHINVPEDGRLVVVGDLHGQLDDLLWILTEGQPSEKTHYLFNGDFVDRGPEQCEVLVLLYALKILHPHSVWLNRGNHEEHRVNKAAGKDGFLQCCVNLYSDTAYKVVQTSFQSLPLCHVINDTIAVVHGGLPSDVGVTISEMRRINRFRECPCSKNRGAELPETREDRIFQALLWSDPKDMKSRVAMSSRGAGVWFNEDVTTEFLKANNLKHLVRSHEVVSSGHKPQHDGKCITVFSASRYCGKDDNLGSYIVILPKLEMNFSEFYIRRGQVTSLKELATRSPSSPALEAIATDPMEGSLLRSRANSVMDDEEDMEEIKKLAIQKVGELIFVKRSQLLAMFQNLDHNKLASVSKRDFIRVCQAVLGETLPWYSLARHLVVPEENGHIFYIRFLERFQNKLATNYMKAWAAKWMDYGRSRITSCAVSLQRFMNDSRDLRKEAKLSYHEVSQALKQCIPGLSMTEIYYLLLHMDKNNDGFLDADEWADEMKSAATGPKSLPVPGILDIWDLRRTNIKKYDAFFKDLENSSWKGVVAKDTFIASVMRVCGDKPDALETWKLTAEYVLYPLFFWKIKKFADR